MITVSNIPGDYNFAPKGKVNTNIDRTGGEKRVWGFTSGDGSGASGVLGRNGPGAFTVEDMPFTLC